MASLSHVTKTDVLRALLEAKQMGIAAFLDAYGYRASKVWQIRHYGVSYPSKAILGVAAGLRARDFFGGVAQAVPVLEALGFEVRRGSRVQGDAELVRLAKDLPFENVDPGSSLHPSAYFASGSNRPGEIRGLATIGHDIGVAAPHLSPASLEALEDLKGTDVQVFCDSGAFSEVTFGADGPKVTKPMDSEAWASVLTKYHRLATALGDQLWVVAPDRVGDQMVTLQRLQVFGPELLELHRLGARILLPVQKGEMTQAEFFAAACATCPDVRFVPALPCKKAATTAGEVAAFFASSRAARKIGHVHLLGLGIRNAKAAAYLSAVPVGVSVSMDSNWIAASVGRGGKTRRYTAARDVARAALGGIVAGAGRVAELALLLAFGLRGLGA